MATLVFTALGTAIGGPLGGALGSLVGSQIDRSLVGGGPRREGPRLKELAVTTSSYGTPIARHLPPALRDKNPTGALWRLIDGRWTHGDVAG